MSKKLVLLHLSDIHFQKPYCLNPDLDRDRPVRTALVKDANFLCNQQIGAVDAILISGDIAYKGDPEEYEVAAQWLEELADAVACSRANVLTVPGNHDVDHDAIKNDIMVRSLRNEIIKANESDRHDVFYNSINNPEVGAVLIRPIKAYNDFAARYGCDINVPGRPFWTQGFNLSDGSRLKLHGLTSVFFRAQMTLKEISI